MDQLSFAFTVFFMLLGPMKLIPAFAAVTRDTDTHFKRAVAIRAALIASAICAFAALAGDSLLGKYRISLDAVRIAGGLVLLISALQAIFNKPRQPARSPDPPRAGQLAASPVAVPGIVTPAGIAAILLFMLCAPQNPGMAKAVGVCLAIVMVLDFLVMYFIDRVMKTPGLPIVLTVVGAVLVFVQAALAIEMVLSALRHLGVLQA